MRGELTGISLDYQTHKPVITLTVDGDIETLEQLRGKPLTVDIKRYRERRSQEANAFYWSIVSQIAEATSQTNAFMHNDMLRKYGQFAIVDGKAIYVVLPDTEAVYDEISASQTYHLYPTDKVRDGRDGKPYRTYMMLRGSSTFDTKEMSRLIDGALYEAKEANVVIDITEQEKREMLERYGKKHPEN